MSEPYYSDEFVTLWHGDCREVLPGLADDGLRADLAVADPPYAETSLAWDQWPTGWLDAVARLTDSLWCFGSARMFDTYGADLAAWHMSQDVIWDKETASTGGTVDRFMRSHEHIRHYYRGQWGAVHHEAQKVEVAWATKGRTVKRPATDKAWHGERGASTWVDDGTRFMLSVLRVPNLVKSALHPTEKPAAVLRPLIVYGCPVGGLVVDPTAGSGSTLAAARSVGRRSVGVEANEAYCEIAAKRLAQGVLDFGAAS